MIKFFRRIRYDLMEKNKTGKPAWPVGRYLKYAIGEIILVVIGILIAIQINNWNEQRKSNLKTTVFLKSLKNDLKSDFIQMDSIYGFRKQRENVFESLTHEIESYSEGNKRRIDSLYSETQGLYQTFFPTVGAYNGALNSGTFEELNNEELKESIRNLYERYYKRLSYNGELLDERVEKISWERINFFDKGKSTIFDLAAIQSGKLMGQTEYLRRTNTIYIQLLSKIKNQIKQVVNLIEKELKEE